MDLKRRLENLEKKVKEIKGDQEHGVFIICREYTSNEEELKRMERHEKELLEKLKDYPEAKIIIAVVDSKGWFFDLPEFDVRVDPNGEVHRYKES